MHYCIYLPNKKFKNIVSIYIYIYSYFYFKLFSSIRNISIRNILLLIFFSFKCLYFYCSLNNLIHMLCCFDLMQLKKYFLLIKMLINNRYVNRKKNVIKGD